MWSCSIFVMDHKCQGPENGLKNKFLAISWYPTHLAIRPNRLRGLGVPTFVSLQHEKVINVLFGRAGHWDSTSCSASKGFNSSGCAHLDFWNPTSSVGFWWHSGQLRNNIVINIGWVRLHPCQWPNVDLGPAK